MKKIYFQCFLSVCFGAVPFLIFSSGCGSKEEKLSAVEGQVTYDKKPVPRGYVIFYPDEAKGNKSKEEPRGTIENGRYKLRTHVRDGAIPGWYKVAISAADQIDPKDPYFTKWLVPEKYADPKTSGLGVEVKENPTSGAYDFHLEKK